MSRVTTRDREACPGCEQARRREFDSLGTGLRTIFDVQVSFDGDRSDEWRWLTAGELDALTLRPDVKFYASEALKVLSE